MKRRNPSHLRSRILGPLPTRDDLIAGVLFGAHSLPATQERLLLRLLHLANTNGNVRAVGQDDLAGSLDVSPRSLRDALRSLGRIGLIKIQRPKRPQANDCATYHIDIKKLKQFAWGFRVLQQAEAILGDAEESRESSADIQSLEEDERQKRRQKHGE